MDKRKSIPIEDVKQIALEIIHRCYDIHSLNEIDLKLGSTKIPTNVVVEKSIMGEWLDKRIEMIID